MNAKPTHLTLENAARFQQQSIVAHYHLRPPYPAEVFDLLTSLITETPRTVLDVGTGTGDLARPLAARVDRVDAVDVSAAMIEAGRQAPGGSHPNIRWITGRLEDAPLAPPYALIVGGESIHWLDWQTAFARFREMLTPNGYVVLLTRSGQTAPWDKELVQLIRRYSLVQNFQAFDLAEELEKGGFFHLTGEKTTAPVLFRQSVEDYVASFHSTTSLSAEDMRPEDLRDFDTRLREIITPHSADGFITFQTSATLQWGKPSAPTP
jgi:ubiquinone/menaquinone biosynthesis C-methylase UbiE